ncbi:MAG: hypothetical protein ABIV06_09065 [Thermoanaerobaculia bacterium]
MKRWLRIHRYLGAFCAPMLILFAVSGSWQLLNYHKTKKDGTYTPPAAVKFASDLHMGEHLEGPAKWAFRGLLWLVAASLVTTSAIGLMMAFRLEPAKGRVALLMAAGIALPLLLFLIARE